MGQANARGPLEERIKQAQQRRHEEERAAMLRNHRIATRLAQLHADIKERGMDAVAEAVADRNVRGMVL